MNNVLIIHPDDRTTDFLCPIYSAIPNKTVVTCQVTKDEIIELMYLHDQVIMLGHGSPYGLMSVSKFPEQGTYIIDDSMVEPLKKKDNNIFVWCNADRFVDRHHLNGAYSGMFISEVSEAMYCGVKTNQQQVNESNDAFANMLGSQLLTGYSLDVVYDNVDMLYEKLTNNNSVAAYNQARWYYSEPVW
jgi:hypothetical protein